jgi:hypothetical protein
MMKVKRRYLAMSGSTSEVGGKILDTSSRNTTSDSKILMPSVTFSPIHRVFQSITCPPSGQTRYYRLTCFSREVEDEDAEERNEDGGKDQVDRVEESLAPDGDVERDVHLSGCTGVNVLVAGDLDDVPRTRLPVIGQVHVFLVQMEVQ